MIVQLFRDNLTIFLFNLIKVIDYDLIMVAVYLRTSQNVSQK